jgi:hypothetical protein
MKVARRAPQPTEGLLPVACVRDGVMALKDGSLRAILDCPTLAFGLKGEAEQRALADGWAGLLNSLSHPIQVAVITRSAATRAGDPQSQAEDDGRRRLRASYSRLLHGLSDQRRLVDRRFLLVVPAEEERSENWSLRPGFIPRLQRRRQPDDDSDSTAQLLRQRMGWIGESLRRIGLDPRPLATGEITELFHRVLCPELAAVQPLPPEEAGEGWAGVIAPAALQESPAEVRLGDRLARTLAITGYPQLLRPTWLEVVLGYDGDLDLSLHIAPAPTQAMMAFLNRRIAELSSTLRIAEEGGRNPDPYRRAALDDASELQDQLAQGRERLFETSLYLTVWAGDEQSLGACTRRAEELLGSMLVHSRRLLFRMEPGLISTLPLGTDRIRMTRCLPTSVLGATFPFTGNDIRADGGLLYGINPQAKSPVVLDRFQLPNHNAVVFATSGAGKSYLVKLELIRAALQGTRVVVVDPEGEYASLVSSLGGTVIPVRPGEKVGIDPFVLNDGGEGTVSARIASLLTLMELLAGGMSANQRAAIEEAISFAYAAQGFTDERQAGNGAPPTLGDILSALTRRLERWTDQVRAEVEQLTLRLDRYVSGSGAWLFTTSGVQARTPSVAAYVLAGLPEEDRAPAMFLVLDRIWSALSANTAPALIVVDEAWWLMQYPDTARFLQRLAKTARKRRAGLTLITQDVSDVLANPVGEAVVSNAAVQILMRQSAHAVPRLAELFLLTPAEQSWLLNAERGEGLLMAMGKRVPFKAVASDEEAALIAGTTARAENEAT